MGKVKRYADNPFEIDRKRTERFKNRFLQFSESLEERAKQLKDVVLTKGLPWAIAAMVNGSVGYYQPSTALREIKKLFEGIYRSETERCLAMARGDLTKMLAKDFSYFWYLERVGNPSVQRTINYVKRRLGKKMDFVTVMTESMMYPTSE